jgi:hypothetical protein
MAVQQVPNPVEPQNVPEPAMNTEAFYYSPWRYLQAMFAIAWAAFAHPFSTTVIDLATGEVRHNASEDEP